MNERVLSPAEVEHVAHLARLALSEPEKQRFARELGSILAYVEHLQDLDTQDVEATLGVQPRANVFREDVVTEPMGPEQALRNAPDREEKYFRIPRILED